MSACARGRGDLRLLAFVATVVLCSCREERCAEASAPEEPGTTPLMMAAFRGDVAAARTLLERGVDVDERNPSGWTALMFAAGLPPQWPRHAHFPGSPAVARLLIAHGASVDAQTATGRTALMMAVASERSEFVELLLDAGADANAADGRGETALVMAAARGLEQVVGLLLRRGASVNAGRHPNGDTALMRALRLAPSLRDVLDEARRVGYFPRRAWDEVREAFGRPAVTRGAVFDRYVRIVRVLLHHGADLEAVNVNGATPLTLAATMGHARLVRLLLAHGADVNATDRAMGDSTALIIAVRNGNGAMVDAVLEARPELDRKDRFGKSALDYATEADDRWAIRALTQAGAR
ncbi:ankyrin repeat domain-containing protein [Anaeromyxobacter terrae]|uniref:ankyrin repeat domain-containing protein n=1 Tax=Anaeromyxobacter terrae TaxID=2925406 RepID=UPI001F56B1EC|nr:ankyrin repeat domain-containing protein [Anaeromyxobacter sp. SG22]